MSDLDIGVGVGWTRIYRIRVGSIARDTAVDFIVVNRDRNPNPLGMRGLISPHYQTGKRTAERNDHRPPAHD